MKKGRLLKRTADKEKTSVKGFFPIKVENFVWGGKVSNSKQVLCTKEESQLLKTSVILYRTT